MDAIVAVQGEDSRRLTGTKRRLNVSGRAFWAGAAMLLAAETMAASPVVALGPARVGFTFRLGAATAKAPELTVRDEDMAAVSVTTNAGVVAVTWKGHPRLGDAFAVRATFAPADTGWRYEMAWEGNASGLDVEEVEFPEIEVPRTEETRLLVPHDHGWLRRIDWTKARKGARLFGSGFTSQCVHMVATVDETADGWYLDARGDARFNPVSFDFFGTGDARTVRMGVKYVPACAPGETAGRLPFDGVFRPYRGDWYAASQIYRAWVKERDWFKRAVTRHRATPKLRDIGLWLWNRGRSAVVTGAVDRVRADVGVPIALDWYWWHRIPYGGQAPYYWPPLEDLATFKGTVAALKAKGVYVQNYVNPLLSDADDPRWTPEKSAEAIRLRDGRIKTSLFNPFFKHRSAWMCGQAPKFMDLMASIVGNLADAGVDAVYLDMMGKDSVLPCWSAAHGHPRGGGTACGAGYRAFMDRIRRSHPGLQFSSEGQTEAFLEDYDSMIMLFLSPQRYGRIAPKDEMPPLYHAIYHDAITFYGNFSILDQVLPWCEGWPEKDRRRETRDLVAAYPDQFAIETCRPVVNGSQPMVQQLLPAQLDDPRLADDYRFLCDTAKFYYANRDLLYDGTMCAPGRLDVAGRTVTFSARGSYTKDGAYPEHVQPDLPTVFHCVWRAPDGSVAAVLVNWSREPQRYRLETPDLGVREGTVPPRSWQIVGR